MKSTPYNPGFGTPFLSCPSSTPNFTFCKDPKNQTIYQIHKVVINKSKFIHHLRIYEWRSTTEFPIVKTKLLKIKNEANQSPDLIEIQLHLEHCPKRLIDLKLMNIGQTLYILKESLIGFERLFNRFGSFQIVGSMIALNDKGFCKVWLNDDFTLNAFPNNQLSEKLMIDQILSYIEAHSAGSKSHKKLFIEMNKCMTFLQCIKNIQIFIKQSKLLVSKKIFFIDQSQEKLKTLSFIDKLKTARPPENNNISQRLSIRSNNGKNNDYGYRRFQSPAKYRCSSPIQLKRFKSEDRLIIIPNSKTSDAETTNQISLREIQTSNCVDVEKRINFITVPSKVPTQQKRQRDCSSFIMNKKEEHDTLKKQLSHSDALKQDKKVNVNTNPERQDYFDEFSSLLFKEQDSNQQEEENDHNNHMNNILKNNGWKDASGLLASVRQLKKSFHKKDQVKKKVETDIHLGKLGSMGRREIAMSILPEEGDQMF